MVTINVNEVFRNKVIPGYKSAQRYSLTKCTCTRGMCNFAREGKKKIRAWSNTMTTTVRFAFSLHHPRGRHEHLASSIKLALLTSPNSRATFREECYCSVAASLKGFEDFPRKEFVHASVCIHARKFNHDANIAAKRICAPHDSFHSTFLGVFFFFF